MRLSHCCLVIAVVAGQSMLAEEVDIALCLVRIAGAHAILLLASWLDIRRLKGDIPRAFWMIGMSFCTIFQTLNDIPFLSQSIGVLY